MKLHSILLLLLSLCPILPGCASTVGSSELVSQQTSEGLALAIAQNDRGRALKLVGLVLEDEAGSGYRFGYEARWNAANAIRDLQLNEEVSLLRKVAGLPGSLPTQQGDAGEDSRRSLLRIFAVKSALSDLTLLGDSQALALNRLHVSSPVISSTAIGNLKQLKDWESTEQVRRILSDRDPTAEAFLDLTSALDFLVASPVAIPQDCVLLRRLTITYRSCFDMKSRPPGIAGCENFVRTAREFEARFTCHSLEADHMSK
jgi:hypothetical protein